MLPEGARGALDALAGGAGLTGGRRERVLDRALRFDDDVAEALYSPTRRVRTYRRSDITALKNNYHGHTPGPGILEGWTLRVTGLAGGATRRFTVADLLARFPFREQITRLVCVEGWSAVSWWGGIAFADLVAAFPPAPGARWAAMRSEVSLDASGRPEPYYVAIDLGTAVHPQSLLVTHHLGRPLTLQHGAPLRLIAPVKLGLKNIKAITDIAWVDAPPPDYWAERGYSYFDGL
jgi:DMSO/TMAO reductase YedYZ molybdopterin-dependent catalytic subunit